MKFISLSLSFGIKDICTGKVPLEAVAGIVPGFQLNAQDSVAINELLVRYLPIYWYKFPQEAADTLNNLLDRGLILPPHPGGQNIASGHWMREEDYSPSMQLNYDHSCEGHNDGELADRMLNNHLKLYTDDVVKLLSEAAAISGAETIVQGS